MVRSGAKRMLPAVTVSRNKLDDSFEDGNGSLSDAVVATGGTIGRGDAPHGTQPRKYEKGVCEHSG